MKTYKAWCGFTDSQFIVRAENENEVKRKLWDYLESRINDPEYWGNDEAMSYEGFISSYSFGMEELDASADVIELAIW